jgi:hypothetical protein
VTDELEHKLRSALTEMAGEVAPSHHPWAEHQRRISARKSRRPFLVAVVAAAVVALVAVPVVVLKVRSDRIEAADIPEPPRPTSATTSRGPSTGEIFQSQGVYQPQAGETVLTQPVIVTQDGDSRTLALTIERSGTRYLCLAQVGGQQIPAVIDGLGGSTCSVLTPPRAGKYVWTSKLVTSASSSSGLMLYVASEPTDNILVRRSEGPYASSYRIAQGADFALFSVYLGSNDPPAAYTARDKANVPLENG